MHTVVTDTDQLKKLIDDAVETALKSNLPDFLRLATRKEWLTKPELIDLTGWSNRTIQHLRDTRQIPFSQHGKKILYPTAGIEAFLKDHHVQPRNAK